VLEWMPGSAFCSRSDALGPAPLSTSVRSFLDMESEQSEPTALSDNERKANRSLLYEAMVDIRNLCQHRGQESYNPFEWHRQYKLSRAAGALADWLHNFANVASRDFNRLDTKSFWREYTEGLCKRFPEHFGPGRWLDYRSRYERNLAEFNKT
jgi:hypothetical protein